jgi:hypothetical protein
MTSSSNRHLLALLLYAILSRRRRRWIPGYKSASENRTKPEKNHITDISRNRNTRRREGRRMHLIFPWPRERRQTTKDREHHSSIFLIIYIYIYISAKGKKHAKKNHNPNTKKQWEKKLQRRLTCSPRSSVWRWSESFLPRKQLEEGDDVPTFPFSFSWSHWGYLIENAF